MQVMTIGAAKVIFFALERVLPRREQPEASGLEVSPSGLELQTTFYKRSVARVPWYGLLAVLFMLVPPPDLRAQPRPPQEQSSEQKKNAAVQAATPPDSVTVPDGTPLTLELEKDLTSATAKVGDTVVFKTPYRVRIDGLVVVPKGTAVSGTVVHVSHARRPSRNGQVTVTVNKLILQGGELATFRPRRSVSKGTEHLAADVGPDGTELGLRGLLWRAALDPLDGAIVLPIVLGMKGEERVYSSGAQVTVYFNGPLNLGRDALMNLQPPSNEGVAQVFFMNQFGDKKVKLFCGQKLVSDLFLHPLRLELKPGTYSFSTGEAKKHEVQLEVREDHQYWIDRDLGGLFVKDFQERRKKIKKLENAAWGGIEVYFDSLSAEDSCPQAAQP